VRAIEYQDEVRGVFGLFGVEDWILPLPVTGREPRERAAQLVREAPALRAQLLARLPAVQRLASAAMAG